MQLYIHVCVYKQSARAKNRDMSMATPCSGPPAWVGGGWGWGMRGRGGKKGGWETEVAVGGRQRRVKKGEGGGREEDVARRLAGATVGDDDA